MVTPTTAVMRSVRAGDRQRRGRGLTSLARFLFGILLFFPTFASAHDIPRDTIITSFVKVYEREVHFVVRVPLDLLADAQFPTTGSVIDREASGPATERALSGIVGMIAIWENDALLAPSQKIAQLSLPSDNSFAAYDTAVAHVHEQLAGDVEIYSGQGSLDAHFVYPISSPTAAFSIQMQLGSDLTKIVRLTTRYLPLAGESRAMIITSATGRVPLNPTFFQAAQTFVAAGFEHILTGIDHLLFLLCLIAPLRKVRALLIVVTAFTLGHSLTLIGSAFNLGPSGPWFPPFVETAIAVSILYTAIENAVGAGLRWRWAIAGVFGLVHGFGFSYALKEYLQFSGSHLLVSLFSFNLGIEIGQIAMLIVFLGALTAVLRGALGGRAGIILLSLLTGHVAWDWMIERGDILWQTEWPRWDVQVGFVWVAWMAGAVLIVATALRLYRKRAAQDGAA